MKFLKQWISICLVLAMLCSYVPVGAAAEEITSDTPETVSSVPAEQTASIEQETVDSAPGELIICAEPIIEVNPLYADIFTEEDFTLSSGPSVQPYSNPVYVDTVEEAAEVLREQMKARIEQASVFIRTTRTDEAYLYDLIDEIFWGALEHTGEPTEGDYLRWQWGYRSSGFQGYGTADGAELEYTYSIVYYTSAEQEQEMDAAVANTLAELDLYDRPDYEKIKGIYDFICGNVVYDYENLNDQNYKLKFSAYAALMNHTAVCQGYALLLYRLALELGIDCRFIGGTGNGGGHGWNIVKLDNRYYNADSTWDAGWVDDYDYFLKCEDHFYDHVRDAKYDTVEFHNAYPMSSADYVPHSHSYTTVVTDPTCTEQGFTTYTCECGHAYIGNEVLPFGHHYESGICKFCGAEDPDYGSIIDSGSCGENLTWVVTNDWTLTISGTGSISSYFSFDDYCFSIQSVVIEDGVTSICDYAFADFRRLTEVTLPESITSIGGNAFYYCISLTEINIPEGVTSIGDGAFEDCKSLTKIVLPESLTSIGADAFYYCISLTEINIPEGVTSIGDRAFDDCSSLTEVTLPESITSIGDGAFSSCSNLTEINIPESVTSIGSYAFDGCSSLTEVTLPESITSIGDRAFDGCSSLTEVTLPESITSIGDGAFSSCSNLTEINIPESVTSIGRYAFVGCISLTEITFCGDAPAFGSDVFTRVTANAHYPKNNETWTSDVMQSYGGDITWVPYGEEVTYTVSIPAIEAAYDAEVQLWVYAVIPDEMLEDDNAYVEMIKDSAFDGAVTTKVTAAQLRMQGKTSYGDYQLSQGMASGEMTKKVTYKFYDGKGNPVTILDENGREVGTEISYSIQDYIDRVLNHGNPSQKEIVRYLAAYGGYAQTYFSQKFPNAAMDAQNPAYNILSKYYLEVPSLTGVTADSITNAVTLKGENAGIQYNGAEGYLDSAIFLRSYFLLSGSTPITGYSFRLTYADASGRIKTMALEPVAAGGEYYVDIPDIPAAYLDYDYVITITNNENGETYTVTTSILAWIKNGLAKFTNEDQKNMLKAMYLYNQAANKFFGK